MRPLSLTLEGFKTFAEPVTFDFSEYPADGLCFVSGNNKVDPELGANGAGKCLPRYTVLQHAETGERDSLGNWLTRFEQGEALSVWGLDADLKLRATRVTDVFPTGVKQLLRVHLANGAHQDMSATHPLIASHGQTAAKDLSIGDYVQTPRQLGELSGAVAKAHGAQTAPDILWVEIVAIEKLEEAETFDISVSNATHLYALDHVITHNSSIWDGMTVALFGKTSRGLKASDIASWQVAADLQTKAEETIAAGGKKPTQKAMTPSVTTRLTFENSSGDQCTINRRWNPNVLTVQIGDKTPKNVDQVELDALIGYNFDEFLQAAYFSQFQDLFLDMGSTERSALVAKVLNLNVWDTYADKAKKDAEVEKEDVEERRRNIERVKGQIEILEASDLTEQIEQWDRDQQEEIAEMEADLAEQAKQEAALREAVQTLTEEHAALVEDLKASRAALDEAVAEGLLPLEKSHAAALREIDDALDALEEAREAANAAADGVDHRTAIRELTNTEASLKSELKRIERQMADLEGRAEKVEKLEGDCSACGQAITEEHVDHELAALEEQLVTLEDEADAAEAQLRKTAKKLRKLEAEEQAAHDKRREQDTDYRRQINEIRAERAEQEKAYKQERQRLNHELRSKAQDRLDDTDAKVQDLSTAKQDAIAKLKHWDYQFRTLQEDIAACREDENPHQLAHDRNVKQLAQLNADRDAQFVELEAAVDAEQASRYWVKGFKNVKLFAVSSALNELEAEVNNALDGLGLGGWEVEFDVDKATKSGTLSKGFFAFISGPDNLEPVKWEAWSGGESQRLRLAASLGLANMIRASKGIDLPFEIWDEPSQWMSDAGINGLLDVLQRRARRLKRQIWLIDHRGLEYPFDAAICVEKTHAGSTIHNVTHELAGSH